MSFINSAKTGVILKMLCYDGLCLTFVFCRAKTFKLLSEIRAIVDVKVMALTATCRDRDQLNIMADLCMNDAIIVQCSADRLNIFFEVREMPANIENWSPILDDDIEIVRILGVVCDRKVFSADQLK